MTGDQIEGLRDIYSSYKGSNGRFGVIKAFEGSLHERTQQSAEVVLGRGEGNERGDLVENESL